MSDERLEDEEALGVHTPVAGASSTPPSTPHQRQTPPFSVEVIPHNIRDMEYNVRGRVLDRAYELERELLHNHLSFDHLIRCHIGNPHAVGQPALTYIREVVSLLTCPELFEPHAEQALLQIYKSDSLNRARSYRQAMGEPGAYTHSQGARCLREEVSTFLERRDGFRADPDTIFLTNGASDAISTVLSVMVGGPSDCVLLPLPQYPLYTATITRLNGHPEFYELDEARGWKCTVDAIDAAWQRATALGKDIKAIVVIDPGNPAPTVLEEEDVEAVLRYASEKRMAVLADEVYQDNLYTFAPATPDGAVGGSADAADATPSPAGTFVPFRKVLMEKALDTQLVSFHSSSKGYYGECGFRGGLMQVENLDKASLALMYKVRCVELCSNTIGQVCMALVVSPPKPGTPSYLQYMSERTAALNDLAQKARFTTEFFNSLEHVSCQPIKGALYAFPQLHFPEQVFRKAADAHQSPDLYYCLQLLNSTGIVSVPGDGFGQKAGTHHLRLTILPKVADLHDAFARFRTFHENFLRQHRDPIPPAIWPIETRDQAIPVAVCARPPVATQPDPSLN